MTHLMLLYPFDSQKNEGLNQGFAKQALKNIVFSKTFSLFDHLAFVIIIDSVGYEATLRWLLADIFKDTNFVLDKVPHGWAQWEDTMFKKYILACQQLKKEKIRWMAEKKLKLMAQHVENSKAICKGDFYGRGLALCSQTMEPMATAVNAMVATSIQRQILIPMKCKCGLSDHLRISFWKCKLNPKNIALQAKEAEEEAKKETENIPPH